MVAIVSRNSLDKMLSGKAVGKSVNPAVHSLAVANLDARFERSVLGWSKPDRSSDTNIKAVHRFFAQMIDQERMQLVKLTVKEFEQAVAGALYTVEAVEFNEEKPSAEWMRSAAEADGIDLQKEEPPQRGVGPRDSRITAPSATLARPRGGIPSRSTEEAVSLAQQVEDFNNDRRRK
jgi:hypothetical protein